MLNIFVMDPRKRLPLLSALFYVCMDGFLILIVLIDVNLSKGFE